MKLSISVYIILHFSRCHVLVVKFIQTRLGYVEDVHIHVYQSNFTSSLRSSIAVLSESIKFSKKMLRCGNFAPQHCIIASALSAFPFY